MKKIARRKTKLSNILYILYHDKQITGNEWHMLSVKNECLSMPLWDFNPEPDYN